MQFYKVICDGQVEEHMAQGFDTCPLIGFFIHLQHVDEALIKDITK